MKQLLISFSFFLLTGLTSFGQNILSKEKILWLPFQWDDPEAKDIILLTSHYDTLNYNLNWQLDTGSPYTFLNGATWDIFAKKYSFLDKRIIRVDTIKSGNYYKIRTPDFTINDKSFLPDTILKNDKMGGGFPEDYLDKYKGFAIGTIGLDIFKNKVLILDFKEGKIGFLDKLSKSFYSNNLRTTNFKFYKNRIIIPVQIGEKEFSFMYDCGASMFTLQTTPKNSKYFAPKIYSDTLFNINNGESGKVYNVPGGTIEKPVKIFNKKYKGLIVYVNDGESDIFDEAKVAGIIGNKLFLNHIVIVDFNVGKFTLID